MRIFFLVIVCLTVAISYYAFFLKAQDPRGTIIILNGPSAAGKSSLQKEFQKMNDDLYLTVGIDGFFDQILPDVDENGKSLKNGEMIRWVDFNQDAEGYQIIALHVGDLGYKVIKGMHRALVAYAHQGNNMIVDYILYDQRWLPDLITTLRGERVYLVGVNAPLEVIEQRESKRGTSPIGQARSHYDTVHQNMIYDLELNTAENTARECAQQIKEFIANNPNPKAMNQLFSRTR